MGSSLLATTSAKESVGLLDSHPSARGSNEFCPHTTSIDLVDINGALVSGCFRDGFHEFAGERFQTQSNVIANVDLSCSCKKRSRFVIGGTNARQRRCSTNSLDSVRERFTDRHVSASMSSRCAYRYTSYGRLRKMLPRPSSHSRPSCPNRKCLARRC
jgi:hypothetical protein